jgi:hypothetical protein
MLGQLNCASTSSSKPMPRSRSARSTARTKRESAKSARATRAPSTVVRLWSLEAPPMTSVRGTSSAAGRPDGEVLVAQRFAVGDRRALRDRPVGLDVERDDPRRSARR